MWREHGKCSHELWHFPSLLKIDKDQGAAAKSQRDPVLLLSRDFPPTH